MIKHQASFDVISILLSVSEFGLDLSESEIQILSYLSCLLAMYDGKKYSEWGYEYSITSLNCPYSHDLSESLAILEKQGKVQVKDGYYFVVEETYKLFHKLSPLSLFQTRTKYTRTASSCLADINIAEMRTAVMSFPELSHNRSLKRTTMLFFLRASLKIYIKHIAN